MVRDVSKNKEQAERTARKIEDRNIIDFLIGLRTAQELSQSDVAKKMGCTQSKVSKLESGTDDNLSLGDFKAYASALGFEMLVVLGKKDRTLVQKINVHVQALRKLMTRLAQFACDGDASIKKGAIGALLRTTKHLAQTVTGAAEVVEEMVACLPNLPKEERQTIQIQADNDSANEQEIARLSRFVKDEELVAC